MIELSHYDRIGGEGTIRIAMQDMFENRIPADNTTSPSLSKIFGERLTNVALRDPHEKAVGWAIGALLGGPGAEKVSVQRIAEWHTQAFSAEVFDAVISHAVGALSAAAIDVNKQEEMQAAITSILPVVDSLRQAMVKPQLPTENTYLT